jgi:hypothetical protein
MPDDFTIFEDSYRLTRPVARQTTPVAVHHHELRDCLLSTMGVKDEQPVRRVGDSSQVSNEGFRRGQHVTIEIDGEQVDGVFDRQAERHDGIDPETVPGGDISTVGWVRRSDTGEIEGFLCSDIEPKPEADVRIAIGRAYEEMPDERRTAAEAFAEDLRATAGVSVDLEVTERQPGRYGLGPIEWTGIFIGTTVATTLIQNLTNDLYAKAKKMLLDRKAKGRRRDTGFIIYGPDGKALRRWDTKNGDHDSGDKS